METPPIFGNTQIVNIDGPPATRKAFLLQRATLEPEPLLGFPPTMDVGIPRRFPSTAWSGDESWEMFPQQILEAY